MVNRHAESVHAQCGNYKTGQQFDIHRNDIILAEQHDDPCNRIPTSTLQIRIAGIAHALKRIPIGHLIILQKKTDEITVWQIAIRRIPFGKIHHACEWI